MKEKMIGVNRSLKLFRLFENTGNSSKTMWEPIDDAKTSYYSAIFKKHMKIFCRSGTLRSGHAVAKLQEHAAKVLIARKSIQASCSFHWLNISNFLKTGLNQNRGGVSKKDNYRLAFSQRSWHFMIYFNQNNSSQLCCGVIHYL